MGKGGFKNTVSFTINAFLEMVKKHKKQIIILIVVLFAFIAVKNYIFRDSIDNRLGYRYEDIDGDGIRNMDDPDVDGDGIANMQDADADGDGIANLEDTLKAAEGLVGIPYDFNMGKFFNIGWRTGKIVCIDVINLSLEKAGLYMEKEMREFYKMNPGAFSNRNGDKPKNAFFARRVKNLREFCVASGWVLPENPRIMPGDIVIFSIYHTAMVDEIREKGYYAIETEQRLITTKKVSSEDMLARHSNPIYVRLPFFTANEGMGKK
ncbi:MAG: hypothetical protein CVV21_09615 [Candidatus Goldiibacteriota bacterium HGW-Goldbacteria-1]|nr:MAG: hypothetical protein CVV21_09615 [Candidatus Goldiibacteriota bacterium HGW-Goldbacteria-1]